MPKQGRRGVQASEPGRDDHTEGTEMTTLKQLRRTTLTAAAVVALAVTMVQPASADTWTRQRSATVEWLQVGAVNGVDGNVHAGRVQATVPVGSRTPSFLYGEMLDYTCPDGYLPDGLWLDAIAQMDANCTLADNLIIETGDLQLKVDGQLHTARLVGDLGYIHGYAVGAPGTFAVDLRWDAPGAKTVTREVWQVSPRVIRVTTSRDASVTGTIDSDEIGSGVQISRGVVERYKFVERG